MLNTYLEINDDDEEEKEMLIHRAKKLLALERHSSDKHLLTAVSGKIHPKDER